VFENVGSYFIKLFFVLNPYLVIPFFLSCTQNFTNAERKIVGAKMCIYSLCLGVVFSLIGNTILSALGVSHASFKAGGGVLLGVAAWNMLYEKPSAPDATSPELAMRSDISLCPLAFPMLVGPATLTTIVGMVKDAEKIGVFEQGLVIATLAFIIGLTYLGVLCGGTVVRILGKNGGMILQKVGGILLVGMSIEMIAYGMKMFYVLP
jgi:multiple antibiotic resistance protein